MRGVVVLVGLSLLGSMAAMSPAGEEAAAPVDNRLAKAEKLVESSDRYLHHRKLRRGMKGYGLTVLEGTEIVRFEVEIESVLAGMAPHRDMILARLRGPGEDDFFTTSGIISGMSGSPVYVPDPESGEAKLIGAVAYGWFAQKRPTCGIQPIVQMLSTAEVAEDREDDAEADGAAAAPAARAHRRDVTAAAVGEFDKRRFLQRLRSAPREAEAAGPRGMQVLPVPVSVGVRSEELLSQMRRSLRPRGWIPVASGAVGERAVEDPGQIRLEPGGAISVPLVAGDQDWAAIGTVTDVRDGRVLAFGHSFYAEGPSELAMGPAYIHTVIASLDSFKLGSTVRTTGRLVWDEQVGVIGRTDLEADWVPLTLHVRSEQTGREQTFRYRICRHKDLTALLAGYLIQDSFMSWSAPPEQHHITYAFRADFGELGAVEMHNVFNGGGAMAVVSDLTRPVVALASNRFAEPAFPRALEADITIRKGDRGGAAERLILDGRLYRPGETVTGTLVLDRYRKQRLRVPVRMPLPEDMPEGDFELQAGGYAFHLKNQFAARPHRFHVDSAEQLFSAVRHTIEPRIDRIYLHVALGEGGLAIGPDALEELPASRVDLLKAAPVRAVQPLRKSLEHAMPTDWYVSGSASAGFRVRRHVNQTPVQGERNDS